MDYDPNKPVALTDYYPVTGAISTQVILNGSNFGTNKDNVRVFFNEKEAAVISVTQSKILVLAPKLPGEKCVIKVQIGEQAGQYEQIFDYIIQTNVSTLVGGDKNSTQNVTGTVTLAEAQFKNSIKDVIAVDANNNVYFAVQESDDGMNSKGYIYVLNEEANQVKLIKNNFGFFLTTPVLTYNVLDNNVYLFMVIVEIMIIPILKRIMDLQRLVWGMCHMIILISIREEKAPWLVGELENVLQ